MEKKVFVVSDNLCNGCMNCLMWCSFSISGGKEFNPLNAKIKMSSDSQGKLHLVSVNCQGNECLKNHSGEPICVEMCPTGTLIYSDSNELKKKRDELKEKTKMQPLFKLIAPWKYPYPWGVWKGNEV